MDIDFTKIRVHNGSQNTGFEELVCQLAHLQKPENAKTFIRKEGAGGDAGIECYWKLQDDSECGWQAKYFIGEMTSSRWQQLDKSFNTAIEKHPNLKKYIVSLPLDKTDSRKKGRGGNQVVSIEDEWNDRLVKWRKIAQENGRNIEFEFWGKHEITLFLTIDDPLYSGRALYWFNEPILGFDTFERIANKSREILSDRYTPEFNVDLPVAHYFDGLCLNTAWWEILKSRTEKLRKQKYRFFKMFLTDNSELLDQDKLLNLENISSNLIGLLLDGIAQRILISNLDEIRNSFDLILEYEENIFKSDNEELFYKEEHRNERGTFYSFFSEHQESLSFLKTKVTKAAETRAALLYGEAGTGKSHLLCDVSLHRIENKLPTVFLLGQHYSGGNPVEFIKSELDLTNYTNKQVFGALDAAGEANKAKTLIIIDAINEGAHRDEWDNYIRGFLKDISAYENISILLSCKTTYLNFILPDSVDEECLVKIEHDGFRGFEHRAATKYLSQQGISKPSSPILAPEFSNPLFLKTCCQALKAEGLSTFPKGLKGITSIFNYFLQSIEKTIAKRKKYNPTEEIIKDTLKNFASKLFPNHLSGIPKSEARTLINAFDPQPNQGDNLFDELLHEGVLSEDISYDKEGKGIPVIRFTYERFSDHFVAQQILEKYTKDNIEELFSKNHPLGTISIENRYYKYAGILDALAVLVADNYVLELEDLLTEEIEIDDWSLSQMFSESVVWRSSGSFSDRTLELLYQLASYGNRSPAIELLLKLSTEPDHPWNAELLHRNLVDKSIAERDHFWSINIALGDQVEEDGEAESIIRTLIEWSCFGELSNIEEERVRLCAIVLFWFLTTSNRKVRDQATKSLVRILSSYPSLLPGLIEKFHLVNDLYLVERLYAVAYGVVCNINDKSLISIIAESVFNHVFKDPQPIPHILLRDYARGILELTLDQNILPKNINPEDFRPPYKSEWPIENPTDNEIEEFVGEKYSSRIKSSLMGFPGDFGNYTMGCVHDWSPTLLSEPRPETGHELKKKFAETYLSGELKEEYLDRIKPVERELMEGESTTINLLDFSDEELLAALRSQQEIERKNEKEFRDKIEANLNEEQKEYFRWLSGLSDDRPAAFSRKWAQRWVCKRAYELGWDEKLFGNFERSCSYGRGGGPSKGALERVGKKYQWIAFHELLARLSDNVHWIDRGYSDIEDKEYYGPWQIYERDIDPTIWLRRSGEYSSFYNEKNTWWQKYDFPFHTINELSEQLEFLWSENIIPNFSEMLQVTDPIHNNLWSVLRGFWMQKQKGDDADESIPKLDAWFRINSIIIKKGEYKKVTEYIGNKNLIDPHAISVPSTQHQGFLGEFPWHQSCRFMTNWCEPNDGFHDLIPVKYLVPVSQYEWESGNTDYSLDSSLSFYLPTKELIDDLNMSRSNENFGSWENEDGELIFLDPSINEYGVSFALIKSKNMLEWLDKNGLEIIWLIGGEKMLFSSYASNFYGRLVFNGLYTMVNNKPVGKFWFEREEPPPQ